ncbi:MAG: ABC transporter C-terminal domain-containing protein, partial [Azospirillaceae bacterium]
RAAPAGASAPASRGARRAKLSYKERRALETLPGEIERLDAEIAALEAALADPQRFTRDAAGATRDTERLASRRAEKERLEQAWLELAVKAEDLGEG